MTRVDITGIYGCLDLPLSYTVEDGTVRGPASYRVADRVWKDRMLVSEEVRTESAQWIKDRIQERP
jgi:hypothetical protein